MLANKMLKRDLVLLPERLSLSSQKYVLRIPVYEKKPFPDPGVTKAPDLGSRSVTLLC
jgi:hypothetical protein